MKDTTPELKTCIKCGTAKPLSAFALNAGKKVRDICKDCHDKHTDNQEGEGSVGGPGRTLHKDYYSDTRPEGEKGEKTLKEQEEQHEKHQKFDLFKKEEKVKQGKMTSFLQKIRTGSPLFGKETATKTPPQAPKQERPDKTNVANDAQTESLTTDPNAIDPSSMRNQYRWTQFAIQSQATRSRGMLNPFFEAEQKSLVGNTEKKAEKKLGTEKKTGLFETPRLPDDDPVKKVINSFKPGKK